MNAMTQDGLKRLEPTLPSSGLISIPNLVSRVNIKEDTLVKSLKRYNVPMLKLTAARAGWFINLSHLGAISYDDQSPKDE